MYKTPKHRKSRIDRNVGKEGEPLHMKIERMTKQKELDKMSKTDTKPLVYTDKKDGVLPNTDIRTDRWAEAAATADKVARDYINSRGKQALKTTKTPEKDGKTESTAGKVETPTTETVTK